MAQQTDAPAGESVNETVIPDRYEEIVSSLGELVEKLESGGLSLEDAVTAFESGIRLARAGAAKLDEAERRVELLLADDRTEPFEPSRSEQAPASRVSGPRGGRG